MLKKSLSNYCENEGFQPGLLELQDKNTGIYMVLDVSKGTFTCKDEQAKAAGISTRVHSTLHVKDKFSILNETYHELSMMSE